MKMERQSKWLMLIGKGLAYENVTKAKTTSAGRSLMEISPKVKDIENAFLAAKAFIDCHSADPDITQEMRDKYSEYQRLLDKLEV